MICENCGNIVQNSTKCYACGFDNKRVDRSPVVAKSSSAMLSSRIIIFMTLVIVINVIFIFINLAGFIDSNQGGARSLFLIAIVASCFEILVAIFVMKMKRWALNAYIGLSIFGALVNLIKLNFLTIILRALLLYFIFRNDWDEFE